MMEVLQSQEKEVKQKKKMVYLERFGVDNPSKSESIKEIKKNRETEEGIERWKKRVRKRVSKREKLEERRIANPINQVESPNCPAQSNSAIKINEKKGSSIIAPVGEYSVRQRQAKIERPKKGRERK